MINDKMPDVNDPELDVFRVRAEKLSYEDIFELLKIAGISYYSRDVPNKLADLSELSQTPKDMLVNPLDEARSRKAVEDFLKSKGV